MKIALEASSFRVRSLDNPRAGGAQLTLLALSLRDVAEDHHMADDSARAVANRRSRELDIHQRPVLALAVGLHGRVSPPGAHRRQNVLELRLFRRGTIGTGWPRISSGAQPKICSAAGFHRITLL
jgi:hypothetical protein